jgi:type VI secretion system protein ImpH
MPSRRPVVLKDRLYEDSCTFDFFQAVRLLGLFQPFRTPVGQVGQVDVPETVRFQAHASLAFPASAIHEIVPPTTPGSVPRMTVTFLGLTGPSGVLPAHYTEMLLPGSYTELRRRAERLKREIKDDERHALRDWLDLFNHRLISLFYRAWEKYRLYPAYERRMQRAGKPAPGQKHTQVGGATEADPITQVLLSLIGLGTPTLRNRLRVDHRFAGGGDRSLVRVDDLALLYFSGLIAQRPPTTLGLETLLQNYFGLPARVLQFQGQWFRLAPESQSRLRDGSNDSLSKNFVIGERVWDVQSKIRLRLGPLGRERFLAFIPDRSPPADQRLSRSFGTFFSLVHLVRLYLGPELDFDVQLVLRAADVPETRLGSPSDPGSRLGWNSWILSRRAAQDADDAVFQGEEVFVVP